MVFDARRWQTLCAAVDVSADVTIRRQIRQPSA
jgi:hypothetical protein